MTTVTVQYKQPVQLFFYIYTGSVVFYIYDLVDSRLITKTLVLMELS